LGIGHASVPVQLFATGLQQNQAIEHGHQHGPVLLDLMNLLQIAQHARHDITRMGCLQIQAQRRRIVGRYAGLIEKRLQALCQALAE
jgi:hypothetical protein